MLSLQIALWVKKKRAKLEIPNSEKKNMSMTPHLTRHDFNFKLSFANTNIYTWQRHFRKEVIEICKS